MQFVVIGMDGTDDEALNRRMANRPAHLALGDELVASGNMWYGTALLDDNGNMKGSVVVMDFPSEVELNAWLDREPYVTGGVWKKIEIHKASTHEPWIFSRTKEFFENR